MKSLPSPRLGCGSLCPRCSPLCSCWLFLSPLLSPGCHWFLVSPHPMCSPHFEVQSHHDSQHDSPFCCLCWGLLGLCTPPQTPWAPPWPPGSGWPGSGLAGQQESGIQSLPTLVQMSLLVCVWGLVRCGCCNRGGHKEVLPVRNSCGPHLDSEPSCRFDLFLGYAGCNVCKTQGNITTGLLWVDLSSDTFHVIFQEIKGNNRK